jgi:hypothetical protein
MSGESTSTDSDSRCRIGIIKSVSVLLSEIINENKEELKKMNKESTGNISLFKISI